MQYIPSNIIDCQTLLSQPVKLSEPTPALARLIDSLDYERKSLLSNPKKDQILYSSTLFLKKVVISYVFYVYRKAMTSNSNKFCLWEQSLPLNPFSL